MQDEVGKEQPGLCAREPALDPFIVDRCHDTTAKLDSGRQGSAKVKASTPDDSLRSRIVGRNQEEEAMSTIQGGPVSKVINCECGEVIQAESDDELVSKVELHVGEAHPELAGKMSRADILAMTEES